MKRYSYCEEPLLSKLPNLTKVTIALNINIKKDKKPCLTHL